MFKNVEVGLYSRGPKLTPPNQQILLKNCIENLIIIIINY